MARSRVNLGKIFHQILKDSGFDENVYFSPPDGKELKYPCIIYSLESDSTRNADNIGFVRYFRYTVTLISRKVDNQKLLDKILELPMCSLSRSYESDNLQHYSFDLYY